MIMKIPQTQLVRARMKSQATALTLVISFGLTILGPRLGLAGEVDLSKVPAAADKKGVTYEKDIRSLFEQSCFKYHGPEKPNGRLRLNSLESALQGGKDGKIIEKGNSAKSLIVRLTARLDEDEAMPPKDKGKPLTREQVGLIRAWIDQGAK